MSLSLEPTDGWAGAGVWPWYPAQCADMEGELRPLGPYLSTPGAVTRASMSGQILGPERAMAHTPPTQVQRVVSGQGTRGSGPTLR